MHLLPRQIDDAAFTALQLIATELQSLRGQFLVEAADESLPPKIRSVLETIHEHLFQSELNVSFVLDRCGIRDKAFPTEFKFYLQTTIHHYIEDKLMLAAMNLLSREEINITLTGYSLGYKSHRSFARAFKRHVGSSASEYRQALLRFSASRQHVSTSSGYELYPLYPEFRRTA